MGEYTAPVIVMLRKCIGSKLGIGRGTMTPSSLKKGFESGTLWFRKVWGRVRAMTDYTRKKIKRQHRVAY